MMTDRARRYLMDALDGQSPGLDPPVRRGLIANAESVDVLRTELEHDIGDIRDLVQGVKRAVIAGSTSVVTAIVVAVVTFVFEK